MSIVPDEIIAKLEELYAKLPTMACQGKCQNCCGPIDMSLAERMRIEERGVQIPPMTDLRVQLWEQNQKFAPTGEPLWCPALNMETGGCDVYDIRPMVCRLWGASESMPCEHGCKPNHLLTDAEAMHFLSLAMQVGGGGRAGEMTDDHVRLMDAMMRDEEAAPLFGRFMRGDRSVADEISNHADRLKKELGISD